MIPIFSSSARSVSSARSWSSCPLSTTTSPEENDRRSASFKRSSEA